MDVLESAPPTTQRIPLEQIRPPAAPRNFSANDLELLADRMRTYGLVDPIVVKRSTGGFEIVTGVRRWLAARKLGWRSLDAKIVDA